MRDSTEQKVPPIPTSHRPMSTTEALREAIAALGYRASVTEILAYARQHFGIARPRLPGEARASTTVRSEQPPAEQPANPPPARRGKGRGKV